MRTLMIVVDAGDPECAAQIEVTEKLISELGAGGLPTLYVFNKCDIGIRDAVLPFEDSKRSGFSYPQRRAKDFRSLQKSWKSSPTAAKNN
ncbi:MAG: hypothetical protein V8S82_02420 [Eubacteriales bacterium]